MSNGCADRTHCGKGHEYTPENTYQRSDGGRACKQCKRDAKKRAKARASIPMTALRYQTACKNGHPVTEETLYIRDGRADECRVCRRASYLRYLDKTNPGRRARLQPEGEVDMHKNDEKRSAPHNVLGIKQAAAPSWRAMSERMEELRTPCFVRPDDFIDFADPRYPDNPEEQEGKPLPSKYQAEALCAECPIRELCLEYALAQKEDFGVWGGKVIVGGRVYRETRKVGGNA